MQENGTSWLLRLLEWASVLFVLLVGLFILALIVMYVLDVTQTRQAVRRNYPVIGRFRYLFESLGEFFRQYFFAMDREELPSSFASTSSRWTVRNCPSIGPSDRGRTGPPRTLTVPWLLVPRVICARSAPCCS